MAGAYEVKNEGKGGEKRRRSECKEKYGGGRGEWREMAQLKERQEREDKVRPRQRKGKERKTRQGEGEDRWW